MNKVKFLTGGIIILFAINVLLLAFVFFGDGPHRPHEGPRKEIIEKLHFDAKQVEAYDALIADHRSKIKTANDNIRTLKKQLYSSLGNTSLNFNKDAVIDSLGKQQMQIEQIHYSHFNDIKALCKPEQQKYFEALSNELAQLFAPSPPKPR